MFAGGCFIKAGFSYSVIASNSETMALPINNVFRPIFTKLTSILVVAGFLIAIPVAQSQNGHDKSRIIGIDLTANQINALHYYYPDLRGQQRAVSIKDERFDTTDLDLRGRYLPTGQEARRMSTHATDMATIVAGAGHSSAAGLGVAPEAMLANVSFAVPMPDSDATYRNLNTWVQNHSYGTEIESFYGPEARSFDANVHRLSSLVHVFSAGNRGLDTVQSGPYAGIPNAATLTGNFKSAKNTLVIGAVAADLSPYAFSSNGPTYDGRIKPDLVTAGGPATSNSAALVSGVVVLLQQAFEEAYGRVPSSALIRSVLLCSAKDVHLPGPDFKTGYGNVNSLKAMDVLQAAQFVEGRIAARDTFRLPLKLATSGSSFSAAIAWIDPPAPVGATKALQNDLNIELVGPDGTHHFPWVLAQHPESVRLEKPAYRGVDTLNSQELIRAEHLPAGAYELVVTTASENPVRQPFALAYHWEHAGEFVWHHPLGKEIMPAYGGKTDYFRWESHVEENFGHLEVRAVEEKQWQRISQDINLRPGVHRWDVPEKEGLYLARMVIGNRSILSDTFAVTRPLVAAPAYVCGDTIRLEWSGTSMASAYALEVFDTMQARFIPTAETQDTTIVLPKENLLAGWYRIQPTFPNGYDGAASYTYDFRKQAPTCYITSFFGEATFEEGVQLFLDLNSIYGLSAIYVDRFDGMEFKQIATLKPNQMDIEWKDTTAASGHNQYRVRLIREGGQVIAYATTNVLYAGRQQFVVFPNPAPRNGYLNVYSDIAPSSNTQFSLYSVQGQLLREASNLAEYATISLEGLPKGVYIYRITDNYREATGRLVIR